MKYKTLKNCGILGFQFHNLRGNGARVSRDLLRKLITNIVRRSTNYYDETGEHVFTYRERQSHSVVCPSIADITPSYLIEHPLRRRPAGEEESYGFVDYWINYRNYTFLIELKHSYFAYRRADSPRQSIKEKFDLAIKQLRSIRKEQCERLKINKGIIKIALQTIVFFESSKDPISIDCLEDQDFKKLLQKLIENAELEKRSNLISLWLLNKRLIESTEYDETFEIYPAVAFIGNIRSRVRFHYREM